MLNTSPDHSPPPFHGRASSGYNGPERRSRTAALAQCVAAMLDEIDYGMVLLNSDGEVLHMNHAAMQQLDGEHPLQRLGKSLCARAAKDVTPFFDALAAAQRGLRRLVPLGTGRQRLGVSVVPVKPSAPLAMLMSADLRANQQTAAPYALLVMGKRQVCQQLSIQGFARSAGLTPAESKVLEALCSGLKPLAIAQQHGVLMSTVRTQICNIRQKTQTRSIAELLRLMSALPPVVGALRAQPQPYPLGALLQ